MGKDYHSVKRFAVVVGVFIVLIWCASLCCSVGYVHASAPWAWDVGLSDGVFYVGRLANACGTVNLYAGWNAEGTRHWACWGFALPAVAGYRAVLIIPMWVLLLIVAELTVFYYWRHRPPSADGLCDACSYDLRGNTSGTCPECGRPIPDAATMSNPKTGA